MNYNYVSGSCDTPLCIMELITECHNSHKHSQSPLTCLKLLYNLYPMQKKTPKNPRIPKTPKSPGHQKHLE